jgi:hypothetical protein
VLKIKIIIKSHESLPIVVRKDMDVYEHGGLANFTSRQIKVKVVSSNPAHSEVYSIQHYVIKFVSDLRQVGGFLRLHQ